MGKIHMKKKVLNKNSKSNVEVHHDINLFPEKQHQFFFPPKPPESLKSEWSLFILISLRTLKILSCKR